MDQSIIYLILLGVIAVVGALFHKAAVPSSLLLVIVGMLLSFFPAFPQVEINPKLILEVFLPLLVYETSALMSWRDVKLNLQPIMVMSIGHVLFITVLVAVAVHYLIPSLGWPLAFVLGAVVSP